MQILAISGSLRSKSYNTTILRAVQSMAPAHVRVMIFEHLSEMPLFNPDLGDGQSFAAVRELRRQIAGSDAVLVASPEYVHGVPGVLKNALDWVVGTGELDGKPVGMINATPALGGAEWIQNSLIEILNVMSGNHVISGAVLKVDAVRKKINEAGLITDLATRLAIENCLNALIQAAFSGKQS